MGIRRGQGQIRRAGPEERPGYQAKDIPQRSSLGGCPGPVLVATVPAHDLPNTCCWRRELLPQKSPISGSSKLDPLLTPVQVNTFNSLLINKGFGFSVLTSQLLGIPLAADTVLLYFLMA